MAIRHVTEQQYTEQEVSAIIRRAGELQPARTPGKGDSPALAGTTLTQLQQAAAELGIDPDLIRQAAGDVAAEDSSDPYSRLLGGPWAVDSDSFVRGSVTEDNWPELIDGIRASTGRVGYP